MAGATDVFSLRNEGMKYLTIRTDRLAAGRFGLEAQDVQEAVHAEADPTWPLCPTCRDHALFVEPDLGADSFWVCHRSGLPVAEVGRLPQSS